MRQKIQILVNQEHTNYCLLLQNKKNIFQLVVNIQIKYSSIKLKQIGIKKNYNVNMKKIVVQNKKLF